MKIFFDTSILVEIDRHNTEIVSLLQSLVEQGHELFISTITVAEILTGANLRKDVTQATSTAKEILNQFMWQDVTGEIASVIAQCYAYLFIEKKQDSVEYQDVIIGATFLAIHADAFVTLNKKDFILLQRIKDHVYTPSELLIFLRDGSMKKKSS